MDVERVIPPIDDSGMGGCDAPSASVRGANLSGTRCSVRHPSVTPVAFDAEGPVGNDAISTSALAGPTVGPFHFRAASLSNG